MLELGPQGRPQVGARGQHLLDDLPVGGVVHVVEHVEVGEAQAPRPRLLGIAVRRAGVQQATLHPPSHGGLAVALRERLAEAQRAPAAVVEVHPEADGVEAASGLAHDLDATVRVVAAGARAPRGQRQRLEVAREGPHLQHRAPHHPGLRLGEGRVGGVVGRDVLEVPGRGVEAEPSRRTHVAEAHLAGALDDPAPLGPGRHALRGGIGGGRHRADCIRAEMSVNPVDWRAAGVVRCLHPGRRPGHAPPRRP